MMNHPHRAPSNVFFSPEWRSLCETDANCKRSFQQTSFSHTHSFGFSSSSNESPKIAAWPKLKILHSTSQWNIAGSCQIIWELFLLSRLTSYHLATMPLSRGQKWWTKTQCVILQEKNATFGGQTLPCTDSVTTLHSNFKRSTHPLKISIHLSPLFALLCRQSLATPSQQKSVLGNWWNFAISLSDRSKPQGSCRGRKQEVWELAEAWKRARRWRIERERKSWTRKWRKERKKWNEWWHQSHNAGP